MVTHQGLTCSADLPEGVAHLGDTVSRGEQLISGDLHKSKSNTNEKEICMLVTCSPETSGKVATFCRTFTLQYTCV